MSRKNVANLAYYHRNKEKSNAWNKAWREAHKAERAAYKKVYDITHPAMSLLLPAKQRAKRKNIPFDLTLDDIIVPEFCPVFGIPLFRGEGKQCANSPTLDRIDNTKGYVKGNVAVISYRANQIKNSGTAQEHRAIADWMDKQ